LNNAALTSVLVFTRTKHGADKVVKVLQRNNIKSLAIHGNKSQNARQNALKSFKDKSIRVLVATDIAARGIDVELLEYVINYEIPNIPETYVHRIGRSGRAGASGIAFSFCDDEERAYVRDIEKLIKNQIPVVKDHPYPLVFTDKPKSNPAPKKGSGGGGRSFDKRKSFGARKSGGGGGNSVAKKPGFRR
jgi:ATP-dependent RNA helicase RhlE